MQSAEKKSKSSDSSEAHYIIENENNFGKANAKLPLWRKIGAGISALLAFIIYFLLLKQKPLEIYPILAE